MISALDMTIQKSSVSDKRTASRMDMASLLAAQQLLAGSGGASLSASQQQQLVGKQRNQNLSLSIDQDSWQECFIFSAATNEQQFAAVVSNAATATSCQVFVIFKIQIFCNQKIKMTLGGTMVQYSHQKSMSSFIGLNSKRLGCPVVHYSVKSSCRHCGYPQS